MKKITAFFLCASMALLFGACKNNSANDSTPAEPDNNIYAFSVKDGVGNDVSLASYEGKVLLVVNTATQCGFTPQYEQLQSLYDRFHSRGLEVLDFPCNQFGAQAPGSNEEIHAFCTGNYNVAFPQMDKICVNGDSTTALYVWLKEQAPFGGFDTTDPRGAYLDKMFRAQDSLYDQNPDIKWNFTKFLIDRQGHVVRRFEPTDPMADLEKAIITLL